MGGPNSWPGYSIVSVVEPESAASGGLPVVVGKPAIHVHPGLSWGALARASGRHAGSVADGRHVALMSSARMGIVHSLRAWGFTQGDEVLVPAYHCLAMVSPLVWMGARVRFYPLREDLSPDEAALRSMLTDRTRAVLAVHYFGFEFDLAALRAECDQHGVALIEDCAHAFFTLRSDGSPVGGTGDYAIASPMKFLPTFDGGVLVTHSGAPVPALTPVAAPVSYELKAFVDILDRAAATHSLHGASGVLSLAARARRRLSGSTVVNVPAAVEGGFGFDPAWLERKPALASRLLLATARRSHIAAARRANYERLVRLVSGSRGVRVLFPELCPGTVPYVLPVLVEDGERLFWRSREASVQVFRWEFTENQQCTVTRRYARSLLQFPCHQSMSSDDLERVSCLLTTSGDDD